jgi:zinc transporter ZupT
MTHRYRLYLFSFAIILAFTTFEELKLRPYLFKNHLFQFGIAGSLPNFLAPLVLLFGSLVLLMSRPDRQLLRTTLSFVVGMIIYELVQPFIPGRVFDINDIIASVLGGLFGYGWVLAIKKLSPLKEKNDN